MEHLLVGWWSVVGGRCWWLVGQWSICWQVGGGWVSIGSVGGSVVGGR